MTTRTALGAALLAGTLTLAPVVHATTIEGVSFPGTANVAGKTVRLNGMGVRIAYVFVEVYVAGLYLEQPTRDGRAATETDEAKRIVLQFLREVTRHEMVDAMKEGFAETAPPSLQPQIDTFSGFFTQPFEAGQQLVLDYAPGQGTTVTIGGQAKGTITGTEFMRALFGIWLGANPPNEALKDGLLGLSS